MIDKKTYFNLLNNTVKKANKNDLDSIKELLTYINMNKPKSLFHYRSCSERSIEAFRNNQIFFNFAINFNDPYDCLVYCDIDAIKKQISKMLDFKNLLKLSESINDKNFIENRPVQIPFEEAQKVLNSLKNQNIKDIFNTIPQESLDTISNYLESLSTNTHNEYVSFYKSQMPIVCLSEKYNNILMWSHYADNHKGFVIEYDTDSLQTKCIACPENKTLNNCTNWKEVILLPIVYTNKRFNATDYIYDNILKTAFQKLGNFNWDLSDKFAQYKVNIYKHKCWSYEKEWRLQLYRLSNDNSITVKPKAIYLGCRISKCYEDILVKYAKEQNIDIYKMAENPSKIKYSLTKKKYKC
ncbi:MAG: DUF2971 domain-containing protein [Anaeroplasmataceae bacterium]|nr:DUF2971 domain-containing protein [Anaeroplasmataceae bacterium]